MNWDLIEDNWVHVTGNTSERWGDLSEEQLADRVQDTYGLTDRDEVAQGQLTDWEQRLSDIARTAH